MATNNTDLEGTRTRPQVKSNIVVVPGNQKSVPTSAGPTGISSRLQHIVDSIAVDQAFPPSHKSTSALKAGIKTGHDIIDPLTLASKAPPPLLPSPAITSVSTNKTSSILSSSVMTCSSSDPGPPLLKPSSVMTCSSSDPGPPRLKPVDPDREKTVMAAVENSRRYREYLSKNLLAKRNLQKQIERKIATAPYPKTFRQVWPVIPVFDPSFIRNYGLEAIMQHFDSSLNSSAAQDKINNSSKVKPICNQCGFDFASAWQIRKSNSKQLLLCEACDFANLKILQRSKLSNQLRDLLASISKEKDQFEAECEETRKQVVAMERQLVQAMMNQQHSFTPLYSASQKPTTTSLTSSRGHITSRGKIHSGAMYVTSAQAVIPSILPSLTTSRDDGSRKRKEISSSVAPPGKSIKLDQTLDKLSKALLERKLDEQRQQVTRGGDVVGTTPDSRKSKRKGTPRHKRHLSSSNSP